MPVQKRRVYMRQLTPLQAFELAPPRRHAVLCLPGPNGSTDMILVHWFTWLNMKRNPMIAYGMETTAALGLNVDTGSTVFLAFPPAKEALLYKKGIRTAEAGKEKTLPKGVVPVEIPGVALPAPQGTEAVLRCEIANSFKYPFRKVRIYNCNLEEARGSTEGLLD